MADAPAPTDTRTAILIAAYNAAATLDRAVASALAAPETAEVCIVDDCSTDATAQHARQWAERDGRVSVIQQTTNAGPGAARNRAIAATTSPWLTILDADDYLLPGRLAALHALAGAADFVADELIRVGENAKTPPPAPAPPRAFARLDFERFVRGNLGARNGPLDLGFLKPMFRRDFLERHRISYHPEMRLGEDYEFYARALAVGAAFIVCSPAGYISVEREGSLSKAHGEADLRALRDCDKTLAKIRPLARGEKKALRQHWHSVDRRLQWVRLIEAVKARNVKAALSTFHTPGAAAFLAAQLGEQALLRASAFAKRRLKPGASRHVA